MRLQAHVICRADLPQELESVRVTAEQDMLAVVDQLARRGIGKRRGPSAQPGTSFENQHTQATRGQANGRAQPGASTAHDNDIRNH